MNMNPLKFLSGEQVLKGVSKAMLRAFGVNEQAAAENLHKVNPETLHHVTPNSLLFSGSMDCTVVGSKQYWAKAYMDLLAMLHERGLPKYFVTFTANEGGWTDMHAACGGRYHAEVAVNSTRHYFHRFDEFYAAYLKPGTQSPLGKLHMCGIAMRTNSGDLYTCMRQFGSMAKPRITPSLDTRPKRLQSPRY